MEEMNDNVTAKIQGIVAQLTELKINRKSIKNTIKKQQATKKKTTTDVNAKLLTSDGNENKKNNPLNYKILVAEASGLFSHAVEKIFSGTEFEYLLVHNGQDALAQIKAFKPDIVLLAYDLPLLSGLEVTKIIRKEHNKIPIIAYTHHRDKAVIKRWIPLGLSDYIIKPSEKSVILKSVIKALKAPITIIHHHKSANKGEIKWLPEYSVGNKEIDEQHKMLFSMTNQFLHQEGKQAAIALFHNLSSYIDLHFEAEENLLKEMNFPHIEEHIKQHNALRKKFTLIQKKLNNYDVDEQHQIAMFLYNWLANHILKADMKFKQYALSIEESSFNQLAQ